MKQAFFWCYPWDIEDEGIESALGRMAGEIGVDALSVATVYPAIEAFRPRIAGAPRTVRHNAAAHFQPQRQRYANTRILPSAASWMKSRNPLEKIARVAEKVGLKLRAWAVCCDNAALAAKHPTTSCVDVFGDPMPRWLCPSNPNVREYVAALVEDLATNYPVETIELEAADFGALSHWDREFQSGISPGEAELALLSWCFCSSCRQRAADRGVDLAQVEASATRHLQRMMRLERPAFDSAESMLEGDDHLAAYQQMRVDSVRSLIGMVRSRTSVRLVVHIDSPCWLSGTDVASVAAECDALVMPYGPAGVVECDEGALAAAGGPARIELALGCYPPHAEDSESLVSRVHRASQEGYLTVGFDNYGLAPEPCLDWVRKAVRFARRESAP